MTSNLCEGGPFLLLNLGPGQDFQGGQSILLHRPHRHPYLCACTLAKGTCLIVRYYPHVAVVWLLPSIQGRGAWPNAHVDETLNPSTSVKPVMNKLQNLFDLLH